MSSRTDTLERLSPLWGAADAPTRWVIWHRATAETSEPFECVVFDRELNVPYDVDEAGDVDGTMLGEVVRRMREAGTPETHVYPGRPCG
ncbi:hypothetical protein [Streptomyces sp. NPDC048361]|uniref:hypothetical protein n=1 Tax=Streptomyces sp. NPDC048361 TaxID=3154720 RepID=UPI003438A7FA